MNLTRRNVSRSLAVLVFTVSAGLTASPATAQMNGMNMPAQGQGKPPLSPAAKAETTLNGKKITVDYSAPSMRGRKIMGELVPFDKVWRTGANAATTLTTEADISISGANGGGVLKVPAGKYTLYTLPAAPGKPWLLIVNKQTGQWGTVYNADQDLGRVPMRSGSLPAPQETMSITFERTVKYSTWMHIKWENTDEWVSIFDVKDMPPIGGMAPNGGMKQ